jgi:hypothetical protein
VDHPNVPAIEIGKRLPISASRGIDDSRVRWPFDVVSGLGDRRHAGEGLEPMGHEPADIQDMVH